MSFPHGVPAGSLFATSVMQPVRQQPMMVQVAAPVRRVTVLPVSSVVMRPMVANPSIHTITAPPRPQIIRTFAPTPTLIANPVAVGVQQQAAAQLTARADEAAIAAAQSPAVTVFVSNITDRASDTLVRQILMKCGTVCAWKRVQGASGKLQAFGFCEYKDAESALRAIYLLHDFQVGDKKLLVKVDSKTQDILNKWKESNGIKKLVDGSEAPPPNAEAARAGMDLLVKEYATELNTPVSNEPVPAKTSSVPKIDELVVRESRNVEENLDGLEESTKTYVSKEIRSFRAAQKQREEEKKREEDVKKRSEKDKRQEERQGGKSKQRDERERERTKKDDRSSTPQRRRDVARHSRSPPSRSSIRRSRTPSRLSRTRTPPRRRSRSRSVHGSSRPRRSRSRSPRRRDDEEDDESFERRRMERKIREKEQAYQERLRAWEMRERRRKREYEKRDEHEAAIRKEMMREAKRLLEFLADYDDMKMDSKYYMGGAMTKRRREWEREKESDTKDCKKEKEEIDAMRQRLVEENYPDPEVAIAKAVKETEDVWQPLLKPDTPPPERRESPIKKERSSSPSSSSGSDSESDREDKSGSSESEEELDRKSPAGPRLVTANLVPVKEGPQKLPTAVASIKQERKESRTSFEPVSQNGSDTPPDDVIKMECDEPNQSPATKTELQSPNVSAKSAVKSEPVMQLPGHNQRKKLKVSDIFNLDDDEEEVPKKRKLVPLEYTHEERDALKPMRSAEDKRKMVRALIEKIPTKKEDLFDYNLDWSMVDEALMEKRIQPWIKKKIVEYIGEEEPTLVEFICSKIVSKSPPERIYGDVSMVLDDEAEVFVVKMWRLLIYETEAKKEGLTAK